MLDTGMSRWALSISMEVGEGGRQSGWGVLLLLTGGVPGAACLPSCPSAAITFHNLELHRGHPASIAACHTPVEAGVLGGELVEDDGVGAIAWLLVQCEPALVLLLDQPLALYQLRAMATLSVFPATPIFQAVCVLRVVGTGHGHGASHHSFHHRLTWGNHGL